MAEFVESINEMIKKMNDLHEQQLVNDFKQKGIIVDACLICSPKIGNDIKKVLHKNKIQIPIVIEKYCEDDKMYMVTDKEIVENIKESLKWTYEV